MSEIQIEELVQNVQSLPDAKARQVALALVQAVLELHRSALERSIEIISAAEDGAAIISALASDPCTSSILLLHDLHPLDLEARVRRALDDPSVHAAGDRVELVSVENGVIHIRVQGGGGLKQAVEKVVWEAAPDAAELMVEGAPDQPTSGFVPLEALLTG